MACATAASPPARAARACTVRQLFDKDSSTYTYLLEDVSTKKAIIVDPVLEQVERDAGIVRELGLDLILAVNTHCHADHVTGSGALKTEFPGLKTAISTTSGCVADQHFEDNEKLSFGLSSLEVLFTPGHTAGCASFYSLAANAVFTGDALLIRGCGRTDFQDGDSRQLYRSVHARLFSLPLDTIVFPAHDYKGRTGSTISEEMQFNPRLTLEEDAFVTVMASLKLSYPKKIDIAVPRNLLCGAE